VDAIVEGKFVEATSQGKYVRGQLIAGGVQRFYLDAEQDPKLAEQVMGLRELQPIRMKVSVYANKGRDGSVYLSVKALSLEGATKSAAA
jgi:hypothetical protein